MAKRKKKGKGKNDPIRRKKVYQIQTSIGESGLVLEDSKIAVRSGDGIVTLKKASDVEIGDQVVYHRQQIEVSFDEILPILRHNKVYANAYDNLYHTEGQNSVPKFLSCLTQAVARKVPEICQSGLEQRILTNTLREEEIDILTEKVYGVLSDNGDPKLNRIPETIRGWFTDMDTLLPRYPELVVPKLAEEFPGLQELATEIKQGGQFVRDYDFVTNTHRLVVRHVNNCSQRKGERREPVVGESEGAERSSTFDSRAYREIYELVTDNFVDQMTEHTLTVRVTGKEEVKSNSQTKARAFQEAKLRKGFVSEEQAKSLDLDVLEMSQAYRQKLILSCLFKEMMNEYSLRNHEGINLEGINKRTLRTICSERDNELTRELLSSEEARKRFYVRNVMVTLNMDGIFYQYLKEFSKELNPFFIIFGEDDQKWRLGNNTAYSAYYGVKKLKSFFRKLTRDIREGKVDEYLGLEEGTTYELFKTIVLLEKSLPSLYIEHLSLMSRIPQRNLVGIKLHYEDNSPKQKERFAKVKERLLKEYGIDVGEKYDNPCLAFTPTYIGGLSSGLTPFIVDGKQVALAIAPEYVLNEELERSFVSDAGTGHYAHRQEVISLLERHGLNPKLIDKFPEFNFRFDKHNPKSPTYES